MHIAPGLFKSETPVRTAGLNETVQMPWGEGDVQWVWPLLLVAMDRRFRARVRARIRVNAVGIQGCC